MQPCFGIMHDRLVKYYGDLRALAVGPVENDNRPCSWGKINYLQLWTKLEMIDCEYLTYWASTC